MGAGDVYKVEFGEEAGAAPFDAPVRGNPYAGDDDADVEALVVNIEGYEGPLDVLLALARTQKVDLRKISVLELVEQYLSFVETAKARRLELAADYLVMAAWLAYLKSRLLIPSPKSDDDEPTGDEMAARLAFQLQRLEAMRAASAKLMARPRLGLDVFGRGAPEGVKVEKTPEWRAELYDLLKAYSDQRVRNVDATYRVQPPRILQIEQARERLSRLLGVIPDWSDLVSLAEAEDADAPRESVVASAFNAALEFAKAGRLELRQSAHFEPVMIRRAPERPPSDEDAAAEYEETAS